MASIFLSHSSKDKFFVRELASRLQAYGVKVWIDEAELLVGDSLTDKIGRAIQTNDFVGVVLSANSIQSEWVQRELQVAMQREFSEKKVVVLPILIERVQLPPFLSDKFYADFSDAEKFEQTFPRLLHALGVPDSRVKPTPAPQVEKQRSKLPSPAERDLASFEDILIVDLDADRTHKPDPKLALYNMHLRLSRMPPSEWQEIFVAERRFPRHTMWRKAWTEGQYIVIFCVPEELEQYHLKDLRQDVENCNKKYRQYLMELAQKEARSQQAAQREHDNLRDIRRRLGFD